MKYVELHDGRVKCVADVQDGGYYPGFPDGCSIATMLLPKDVAEPTQGQLWNEESRSFVDFVEDLVVAEKRYIDAVQFHLDTTAQSRGYDGILSLASYATSTVDRFCTEGAAGLAWRDACWVYCNQVLTDVQGGKRVPPTVAQLISELPAMTWGA